MASVHVLDWEHVTGEFIEALVLYNCVGRDYRIGSCQVVQYLRDEVAQASVAEHNLLIGTGSSWEALPSRVCGDKDFMLINSTWPIVRCDPLGCEGGPYDLQRSETRGTVIAQCNTKHPAFLRLFPTNDTGKLFSSMVESGCINSETFAGIATSDRTERHGPAHASAAFQTVPGMVMRDLVPCLISPSWPSCAAEIFTRQRSHGWPSAQVLEQIKQGGCHVVSKAFPNSDSPTLDFRWSFSVAEKALCHHMDDTMAGCMYLLKTFKKKHWKDDSCPAICSFFFKTACFWTLEEKGTSGKVLSLTSTVLDWLIGCYGDGCLPNYFVREQNLIGHLAHEVCLVVAAQLSCIKHDLFSEALSCMKVDKPVIDFIQSFASKMNITIGVLSDECDGKEFIGCLSNSFRKVDLLKGVTKSILPRGQLFGKKESYTFVWELMAVELDTYNTIQAEIPNHGFMPPGRPESILEPIFRHAASFVPRAMVQPLETIEKRVIGDIYLKCLENVKGESSESESKDAVYGYFARNKQIYTPDGNLDKKEHYEELERLAEHFFKKACVPLQSPDGRSTDDCFLGKVNLAKFYYITENQSEFGRLVDELEECPNQDTVREWGLNLVKGLSRLTEEILKVISKPSSDTILSTLTKKMFPGSFMTSTCVAWIFIIVKAHKENNELKKGIAAIRLMDAIVHWLNSWYYAGNESEQTVIRQAVFDIRAAIPSSWKGFVEMYAFSKLKFLVRHSTSVLELDLD